MRAGLFFDTETTGLPLFNEPSEDPRQPHIVQLGAILADLDERKALATVDVIIKPDGWTIPDEVAKVHGITTERAHDLGVPEKVAIEMLLELWRGGQRTRIAHNEQFDARILHIGLKRFLPLFADPWAKGDARCTATMSTPILKLPPTERMRAAGRFHHKTPNLGEAFKHFTGRELEGAHSALVDVAACMACYFAMTAQAPEPQAA